MLNVKALNQKVIVELPEKKEEKTASGLYIPPSSEKKNNTAKVAAMGEVATPEISVGDTVVFSEFSGSEIEYEGKKYLVLDYDAIVAKLVEVEEL